MCGTGEGGKRSREGQGEEGEGEGKREGVYSQFAITEMTPRQSRMRGFQ